jgi:hypothetical protein
MCSVKAKRDLGDYPDYWQDLGVIFTGKGFGDLHGVRFFDLNGDVGCFFFFFVSYGRV